MLKILSDKLHQARYYSLAAIIFPFIFISCFFSDEKKIAVQEPKKNFSDTVVKDIPLTNNGKPSPVYLAMQAFERSLNLDVLEEGFDSLQIRLWAAYTFTDTIQLLIVKRQEQQWIAEFGTIKYKDDVRHGNIQILNNKFEYKTPKSGWDNFVKELLKTRILTLPDVYEISNYPSPIHADNFSVEFATNNLYRFYSYPAPHSAMAEVLEAKNMETILQLMEKEFSFKRLRSGPVRN